MSVRSFLRSASLVVALLLAAAQALAASFPAPKQGTWIVNDFRFHSGEVLPELKLHYQTVGEPTGQPVLVLHGTNGSAASMLGAAFAGELFGPGQPLDATRYFIILPDAIGTGESSKPSDGLRMKFPAYNYDDMVSAQYRLVREHLGVKHLRLVIGNSMGGMQGWMWAEKYPGMMDVAVPMASLPVPMSGRNWMLRRLLTESIRRDPAWNEGNYTTQPPGFQLASVFFAIAATGSNHLYMKLGPTREQADAVLEARLHPGAMAGDANDHLLQWESAADYDPSAGLGKITATVLAINSQDDELDPVELGLLDREMARVKHGTTYIIPASEQTVGHGTTTQARFWKDELEKVLKTAPRL